MKKVLIVLFGLLAIVGCKDDDDKAGPATEAQLQAVTGHWYAELSVSGETANWRTEEEGDMAAYDKIAALFYLDGFMQQNWWGYLYLQADDMVNYGGIDLSDKNNMFEFTMDSDGNITPSSQLANAPKVSNMHYDSEKDVITADVEYDGSSLFLTFVRPSDSQSLQLNEFFSILQEEGIVGGYEDKGFEQRTDVEDDDATEPSRANTTNFIE